MTRGSPKQHDLKHGLRGQGLRGQGLRVPGKAAREDTRATNLRLVLQHLLTGEVLSRADLVRATNLTAATVSTLVTQLENDGLIAEVGPRRDEAQIGKPPRMLQLQPDSRHVVAVDLSDPETLRAAVVDLSGALQTRLDEPVEGARGADAVAKVKRLVERAVAAATSPVLGIGIGSPGVVSFDGVIVEAANIGWHQLDLATRLERSVGCPTYVGNDANIAAIAEFTRGGHDCANLAVVKIGSGVGAGFVLNGSPYRGEHSSAGEIGHLVVDPDGPACRCGNRGCVETFVALPALEAAAIPDGERLPSTAHRVAAEQLGAALAAMVAILDIDRIFIAGPRHVLGDDFCEIAGERLNARCLNRVADSVTVEFTNLGDDIVLLGAVALVLSQELGVA